MPLRFLLGNLAVLKVLAYGLNNYSPNLGLCRTIHAEADAISKLKPRQKTKYLKPVNICVIKTSKTGKLGYSRPCFNCMLGMLNNAPMKGYRIEWVYFTTMEGNLERHKLSHLIQSGKYHVSSFYKNSNFKHPLLVQ
jgi:hypothetical protein